MESEKATVQTQRLRLNSRSMEVAPVHPAGNVVLSASFYKGKGQRTGPGSSTGRQEPWSCRCLLAPPLRMRPPSPLSCAIDYRAVIECWPQITTAIIITSLEWHLCFYLQPLWQWQQPHGLATTIASTITTMARVVRTATVHPALQLDPRYDPVSLPLCPLADSSRASHCRLGTVQDQEVPAQA